MHAYTCIYLYACFNLLHLNICVCVHASVQVCVCGNTQCFHVSMCVTVCVYVCVCVCVIIGRIFSCLSLTGFQY